MNPASNFTRTDGRWATYTATCPPGVVTVARIARVQPSLMSTGLDAAHRVLAPQADRALHGVVLVRPGQRLLVLRDRRSPSAPPGPPRRRRRRPRARAVPAGSGLSALTLWVATVRSPPLPVLSTNSPPKRLSQTIAGSSSATSAVADRRSSARTSSSGTKTPEPGQERLAEAAEVADPRWGSARAAPSPGRGGPRSTARTRPRRQIPGRLPAAASGVEQAPKPGLSAVGLLAAAARLRHVRLRHTLVLTTCRSRHPPAPQEP